MTGVTVTAPEALITEQVGAGVGAVSPPGGVRETVGDGSLRLELRTHQRGVRVTLETNRGPEVTEPLETPVGETSGNPSPEPRPVGADDETRNKDFQDSGVRNCG